MKQRRRDGLRFAMAVGGFGVALGAYIGFATRDPVAARLMAALGISLGLGGFAFLEVVSGARYYLMHLSPIVPNAVKNIWRVGTLLALTFWTAAIWFSRAQWHDAVLVVDAIILTLIWAMTMPSSDEADGLRERGPA